MKLENFSELMDNFRKTSDMFSELNNIGFDFFEGKYNLVEQYDTLFYNILKLYYDEEGIDWINWFIYESDWGEKDFSLIPTINEENKSKDMHGAHDKDGNPIAYSIESLWELLEKDYKIK